MSAHFPLLLPPLQLAYILRNLQTPFAAPHQLTAYRISTLESCVVHHLSVGFLQTILLYSFFLPSSKPCWFPSFSPASHNYFFVFCSLKILSWGDKCWWISQFLRCLPAFSAFLRWHFESRFYQYFIICFPYIRWAWCSDSFLSNIFNGWRYY